jgi:hypothetical protein
MSVMLHDYFGFNFSSPDRSANHCTDFRLLFRLCRRHHHDASFAWDFGDVTAYGGFAILGLCSPPMPRVDCTRAPSLRSRRYRLISHLESTLSRFRESRVSWASAFALGFHGHALPTISQYRRFVAISCHTPKLPLGNAQDTTFRHLVYATTGLWKRS